MSCRVLGRRVEQMVLRELLDQGKRRGIRRLVGIYHPTERNQMVQDHYSKLGFSATGAHQDGTTIWELDVNSADVKRAAMSVRSIGFDQLTRAQNT